MSASANKRATQEEYDRLSKQVEELNSVVNKQKDVVRELKEKKASKEQLNPEVEKLKALKEQLDALSKQWREADPNKLRIDREGFDELLKRRFFVVPSFEIYGGVAGLYDYGPPGCAIKANLLNLWRQHFVLTENMLELDSTCLTPEIVLKTSGHVDRFNDLMVKDLKTGACYRADKLLEELIDAKLADPQTTPEQRKELEIIRAQVDSFEPAELGDKIKALGGKAPETGNELSDPFPFNLMFSTQIGPTGTLKGYMRPETAQSIFVNFRRMLDYNGGKIPFAGATIGQAYRNEIAPRSGLLRVREFTLAEIEHFVNPNDKSHPRFHTVEKLELTLFPRENQVANTGVIQKTLGDALKEGIIANQTVAYFLGRVHLFLKEAGILEQGLRFRQHLRDEMAHYAADCWDAEILTSYGWVECVGIADRACYDLTAHATASKTEMVAFETFKEPQLVEYVDRALNKGQISSKFKKDTPRVLKYLEELPDAEALALQKVLDANGVATIAIPAAGNNDNTVTENVEITKQMVTFATKTKKVSGRNYTPHVIEPSFGVGRILYAILEHSYWVRQGEGNEQRAVLSLSSSIAPYKCAVLPLSGQEMFDQYISRIAHDLAYNNISFKIDESGQSIGRRYARTDELGVPYIITIDFDVEKDQTVTLRERDSCTQVRVPIAEVVTVVRDILDKRTTWEAVRAKYPEQKQTASEKIGKGN